jgi:hypothetical protein
MSPQHQLSRPAISTPWGKCQRIVKTFLPEEIDDAIAARASAQRCSKAEVVRAIVLDAVKGGAIVEASYRDSFRARAFSGPQTDEREQSK